MFLNDRLNSFHFFQKTRPPSWIPCSPTSWIPYSPSLLQIRMGVNGQNGYPKNDPKCKRRNVQQCWWCSLINWDFQCSRLKSWPSLEDDSALINLFLFFTKLEEGVLLLFIFEIETKKIMLVAISDYEKIHFQFRWWCQELG